MNSPEERRLRTLFANLRAEDRSAAPPFDRTVAAAAASSHRVSFLRVSLMAVPVLAIAALLAVRTHRSQDAVPREIAGWSSPTAFLLETPGIQFLNQTPRLGVTLPALPAAQDGTK
jgi:hypothetical protein